MEEQMRNMSLFGENKTAMINKTTENYKSSHNSPEATFNDSGANNHKPNKKYKDSMFRDLFSRHEYMVELYKALTGDYDVDPDTVEDISLSGVLFQKRKNDLAISSNSRSLIILSEHQSTVNENMPLRMSIYLGREYEKLYSGLEMYKKKQIPLSRPEFVVLYNGEDDIPAVSYMRLSDAFQGTDYNYSLYDDGTRYDLVVKIYNLNRVDEIGNLAVCDVIRDYSKFIEIVSINRKNGMGLEDALVTAINYCIENGILANYLAENSTEVKNMLYQEYDENTARKVYGDERYEEGLDKGIKEGIEKGVLSTVSTAYKYTKNINASISDAMEKFNLSEDKVIEILQKNKDKLEF